MPSGRKLPGEVQNAIGRHDIELVRLFRDGPRYYTALVKASDQQGILKVVLPANPGRQNPQSVSELSKLVRREILLLQLFERHEADLSGLSPHLLDFGNDEPAWYLREHLDGNAFTHPEAPFVYGPEFFKAIPAAQVASYVASVHLISRLDHDMLGLLEETRFDLWSYERLSNWRGIAQVIPALRALVPAIAERFDQARETYDFATADLSQAVIAHNELYPDHFFLINRRLCLIDWENVGLSNRLRDLVSVWQRSFQNPTWQRSLRDAIAAEGVLEGGGMAVWRTEILMQSIANLGYFWRENFADKAYQAAATSFLLESIEAVLHDKAI